MAKLAMKKIEIVALLCDSKNIIERLQRRGVVELTNITDEGLAKINTSASIAKFEQNLTEARNVHDIICGVYDEKKEPLSFLEGRRAMSTEEFAKQIQNAPNILHVCNIVMSLSGRISKDRNEISRLNTKIDTLTPWERLDISPDLGGTCSAVCFCAALPRSVSQEEIYSLAAEFDGGLDLYAEVVNRRKEYTNVFFMASKEQREVLENFAASLNAVYFKPGINRAPSEEIKLCRGKIEELSRDIEELEKSISSYV